MRHSQAPTTRDHEGDIVEDTLKTRLIPWVHPGAPNRYATDELRAKPAAAVTGKNAARGMIGHPCDDFHPMPEPYQFPAQRAQPHLSGANFGLEELSKDQESHVASALT